VDPRLILTRGVTTGLRLGRGTADRVVRVAGPQLGRVADVLATRVRRPQQSTVTTFTPSKRPLDAEPEQAPSDVPSPATVARNIGPQRPVAKPAPAPNPQRAPGAKLPPPRPSTS
jgi:hypothetical protein